MKKILVLLAMASALMACNDKKETEETVITTETTTDPNAPGPDVNSTTVTKTIETDTAEVSISVQEADPVAIDTTD